MKKTLLISIFALFCFGLFAHSASRLQLSVDMSKKWGNTLEVKVIHSGGSSHYINKIVVVLNEKEILNHKLFAQTSDKSQRVYYTIPSLKKGDKLYVEATCNKGGTKVSETVVK